VVTDIALHIAFIDNIEESETWMILMLRTYSTVKRTSSKNRSECPLWKIRFLEISITLLVILEIIRDNRPDFSAVRAELAEPNLLSLGNNVSRNESLLVLAFMTEWFSCREKEVVVRRVVGHSILLRI
jgi:hypothetical protein